MHVNYRGCEVQNVMDPEEWEGRVYQHVQDKREAGLWINC